MVDVAFPSTHENSSLSEPHGPMFLWNQRFAGGSKGDPGSRPGAPGERPGEPSGGRLRWRREEGERWCAGRAEGAFVEGAGEVWSWREDAASWKSIFEVEYIFLNAHIYLLILIQSAEGLCNDPLYLYSWNFVCWVRQGRYVADKYADS